MMKFLKTNPIKVILTSVLVLLVALSVLPQKAHSAVVMARSPSISVRPTISMPNANKPSVKSIQPNSKGMVNQTATAVLASQMIPTVCKEYSKKNSRCERK